MNDKDERIKNEEDFGTLRNEFDLRIKRDNYDTNVSELISYFINTIVKDPENSPQCDVLNIIYHEIIKHEKLSQNDIDTITKTSFLESLVSFSMDFESLNINTSLEILLSIKRFEEVLELLISNFPILHSIECVMKYYSVNEEACTDLLKINESILFSDISEPSFVNEIFEALCNLIQINSNKIKDQVFRCISTLIISQECACDIQLPNITICIALEIFSTFPFIDGVVYAITSCIYSDHSLISYLSPEIVEKIVFGDITQCKVGFISVACSVGLPELTLYIANLINWDSLFDQIDIYPNSILDILTYTLGEDPSYAEIYEAHNLYSNIIPYVRNEDLDYDDFARIVLISFPFLSADTIENLLDSSAFEVISDGISMTEAPHIYAELTVRFLMFGQRSNEPLFHKISEQIDEFGIFTDLEDHGYTINEDFSINIC